MNTRDNEDGTETAAQAITEAITAEVGRVVVGNETAVELLTIGLLTRGHILVEGVPGIAKTTLVNLFARALGLDYNRAQMTPDTLPADITGTHVYREETGEFELHRGPVFANLLLVDEINRAPPKTQSALLEAMAEEQVSIGGETLSLPDPFMVVATQNPIEMEGVFELPEGQRDRFQFKLTLDLPERAVEAEMLERFDDNPRLGPPTVEQTVSVDEIRAARAEVEAVHVAPQVHDYILDLVRETRSHADVRHGASPRATLAFLNSAKAHAAIRGRTYAIPDDIKAVAKPILDHRLVLSADAELSDVVPAEIVAGIVDRIDLPDTDAAEWGAAATGED